MNATLGLSEDTIILTGPLSARGIGALWPEAIKAARRAQPTELRLDVSNATALDTSGAALILAMEAAHGGKLVVAGASERTIALLEQLRSALPDPGARRLAAGTRGRTGMFRRLRIRIVFFGEMVIALCDLPTKLRFLRGRIS